MTNEAKLRGVLLWMTMAASLLAIVGLAGLVFQLDQLRASGNRSMAAVLFLTAWSIVFVVMTLLRAPATPIVASAGLVLWVAYRVSVAILSEGWPVVIDLLGQAVLATGFCGYMAAGVRPNAYYRRRLPTP